MVAGPLKFEELNREDKKKVCERPDYVEGQPNLTLIGSWIMEWRIIAIFSKEKKKITSGTEQVDQYRSLGYLS